MIKSLTPFITEPPVWVWGILLVLIFIGWRATREREVSARRYALLPLFGIMSFVTIAQNEPTASTWLAFALAYLAGGAIGWRAQGGIILSTESGRARLRGEWLTFATVMVMFWLRFVRAATEAVSPDTVNSPQFTYGFTVVAGIAAGIFLGRSIRTFRAAYAAVASTQTRAS